MPKEAKKLTDKQVAALKTAGHYPVGGTQGLALKVTPKRSDDGVARSWVLRLTTGETRISSTGKPFAVRRDFGLGSYPEIGLAEARSLAADLRADIRAGIDPVEQRKTEKAKRLSEQAKRRTFEDAARDCHKIKAAEFTNPKHAAQWLTTLETYAFPTIGKLPVADVETAHIVRLMEPIWITKHSIAERVLQRIHAVLSYATAAKFRTGPNPADKKGNLDRLLPDAKAVKRKAGAKKHHARVDVERIPDFMADARTRSSISALALRFAVLTAARSGEVRGARWDEIDLKARVWKLSAERMKAGRSHTVPLSDAAVDLLKQLEPDGELLFPNLSGGALSDMTLSKMLKDMHAAAVKRGEPGYLDSDQGRVATPHGTARSSFKDWSRSRRYPDEWSELALAHINSDETRAAYARDELLEERRELMQAWGDYCTLAAANVVGMRARA